MLKRILMGTLMLLAFQSSLQAETPSIENVTTLYVATFDRTPDVAGLKYWVNDSGLSLEGVASSFMEQPESKAKYYPEDTIYVHDFIDTIYINVFDRYPDSEGKEYWVDYILAGGFSRISVFILAVINGAQGSDATLLVEKRQNALDAIRDELDEITAPIDPITIEPVEGLKILAGFIQDFNTGAAIMNAKIRLDFISPENTSVYYDSYTDSNGYYILRMDENIFSKYTTDESLIIYASREGYIPVTKGIGINQYNIFEMNFELKQIPENVIIVEIDPTLHHLGNDNYSGTVNSKFQKDTEGLTFSKNFNVSLSQAACSEALLSFYGKGIQTGGELYLNTSGWGLNEGPSSGEFVQYTIPLDSSNYHMGENTIKIESTKGSSYDYDDFEFNNIQIEFCP